MPKLSTYDEFIKDPQQKELLEKEYKELLVSELLYAIMQCDHQSVKRLATQVGISSAVIEQLLADDYKAPVLAAFLKELDAVGYQLSIEFKR